MFSWCINQSIGNTLSHIQQGSYKSGKFNFFHDQGLLWFCKNVRNFTFQLYKATTKNPLIIWFVCQMGLFLDPSQGRIMLLPKYDWRQNRQALRDSPCHSKIPKVHEDIRADLTVLQVNLSQIGNKNHWIPLTCMHNIILFSCLQLLQNTICKDFGSNNK